MSGNADLSTLALNFTRFADSARNAGNVAFGGTGDSVEITGSVTGNVITGTAAADHINGGASRQHHRLTAGAEDDVFTGTAASDVFVLSTFAELVQGYSVDRHN